MQRPRSITLPRRLQIPRRESTDVAPVQSTLLALAVFLIPVLVLAFLILYLSPNNLSAELFAWPISPPMSAMMLGSTYLGGAYFFAIVLRSRQWRHVWLGFLPITVFAGVLGVATILHWDIFDPGHLGFQLWAALYFLVPLILPILWYRNHRLTTVYPMGREGELPNPIRWAFAGLGIVLTFLGLLLFILPEQMIDVWPWALTPLTARTMAAIYLLPGLVSLSIAYEFSWSASRYLLQAMAVTLVPTLIAVFLNRGDFDWSSFASWGFTGGLVAILILLAVTYWSMSQQHG